MVLVRPARSGAFNSTGLPGSSFFSALRKTAARNSYNAVSINRDAALSIVTAGGCPALGRQHSRPRGRRYGHKSFLRAGGARAACDLHICHRATAGLSAAGKLPSAERLPTTSRELPATAGELSAAASTAGLSAAGSTAGLSAAGSTTGLPADTIAAGLSATAGQLSAVPVNRWLLAAAGTQLPAAAELSTAGLSTASGGVTAPAA